MMIKMWCWYCKEEVTAIYESKATIECWKCWRCGQVLDIEVKDDD